MGGKGVLLQGAKPSLPAIDAKAITQAMIARANSAVAMAPKE